MAKACMDCRFVRGFADSGKLECHRGAPVVMTHAARPASSGGWTPAYTTTTFPTVDALDSCGEFSDASSLHLPNREAVAGWLERMKEQEAPCSD